MKSLLAIVFLINCLAFFMLSHMQKHSEQLSDQIPNNADFPVVSPQPIIMLSELSADELTALNSSALLGSDPMETRDVDARQCELLGPFEQKPIADMALKDLVAKNSLQEMIVFEQISSNYWLKIPLELSVNIADNVWSRYESKKRYKEVCMKVAYTLKFH